ncbi:MAG: protein kinase, partial [Chthoniobacter sp.]
MPRPSEIYGKPWVEPEFIIVLDIYLRHRGEPRSTASPFVQEVARLLGRTPASVLMRMENFASLDPLFRQRRIGLLNIRPMGIEVFNKWQHNPDGLKECAAVFAREIKPDKTPDLFEPLPSSYPTAFGRYELLDRIGEGYFGAVYSCIDTDSGEVRALKIIRTDKLSEKEVVARFRREIHALQAVNHPNIISIYEDNLDETADFPGFVMDHAIKSLADYIHDLANEKPVEMRERPVISDAEAILIIRDVIAGIGALHQHAPPVIH